MKRNKWTSRKFWVMVLTGIANVAALASGADLQDVGLADVPPIIWVVAETAIDMIKKEA